MSETKQLNRLGHYLRARLKEARNDSGVGVDAPRVNVDGVGKVVSGAYEQLRNAAEYTQDHLLLEKAIRRFYKRSIDLHGKTKIDKSIAEELIVELTQAGYIENDSQPLEIIDDLTKVITRHYENYWRLEKHGVDGGVAESWTLDLLSVESERLIVRDKKQAAFAQFAFGYYQATLPKDPFAQDGALKENYEACLFVAVHKALLKSDLATVRFAMQNLYQPADSDVAAYAAFHAEVDRVFYLTLTDKIVRHIRKTGAPLRVLKSMIDDNDNVDDQLLEPSRFHAAYEMQTKYEYEQARKKVNKGIIKSIIFLIITKMIIGLAIEIPYDILVYGAILYVPLAVNLLAPVLYMTILGLSLRLPGAANTVALKSSINKMLYGDLDKPSLHAKSRTKAYSVGFKIAYGLMFIIVFGLALLGLVALNFNIVQGVIFFVFLAAASFLGFRLSRIVRELELVTNKPGMFAAARDFLYMPFILLGQWLSEKYEKINIVALMLDTLIELPLKTVLRLVRQWSSFLSEKKDEI